MISTERFYQLKNQENLSTNEYKLLLDFIVSRNNIKDRVLTMKETLLYSKKFFSLNERITIIESFKNDLNRILVYLQSCESNVYFLREKSNLI